MSLPIISLFSQNTEPSSLPFVWGTNVKPKQFEPDSLQFKQTEFLTGYQWTGTPRFNRLMKNNANSGAASFDTSSERSKEPTCRFFTSFRKVGRKPTNTYF